MGYLPLKSENEETISWSKRFATGEWRLSQI